MSASLREPIQYPVDGLTPEQFESLVFLLARTIHPNVVPVRRKDQGLDARLPGADGRTLRGWQAKRFTDGIHWGQCQESVRRAIAFWRPSHITFCFAHDLSALEQQSFGTELIERFPEVRLDFWPASGLQRLIRDTEEGQRAAAWLFENREATMEAVIRATAVGGELESTRQAAERQAVIQAFMDRDPHVQYTTVSRSPGAPATPPAEETFLSVILVEDGQEVRFDASERYAGALDDLGVAPRLVFSDDENGRRAREAVERLFREGGAEVIPSGMGTALGAIPVGLRGLLPEEGVWGEARLEAEPAARPEPAVTPPSPVLVRTDGVELAVVLAPIDPIEGWQRTHAGGAGGLQVLLSSREPDGSMELGLDFRHTRGVGTGLEQLIACQIMVAGLLGSAVELLVMAPDGIRHLASGTMNAPDDVEHMVDGFRQLEVFLRYVAEVEAWLGAPLDPPANPTAQDAQALGQIIARIRQPERGITWRRVGLAPGAQTPEGEGPFQFALLRPLFGRIFGREVFLGVEMLHFPEGRLEGSPPAIVPIGDEGSGLARLSRPDDLPPDVAHPPDLGATAST